MGQIVIDHPHTEYVSERITNINECENHLFAARFAARQLRLELEKENPSLCKIDSLSKSVLDTLEFVDTFEFMIERRKTIVCSHLDEDQL
jgi:hypothetical protein